MADFNPLNFIADHAGMNLADAIKEAYEQGKRDTLPEPKTGKWLEIPHTFMWQCSLCSWINDISSDFNYCPDCGAKMEGE